MEIRSLGMQMTPNEGIKTVSEFLRSICSENPRISELSFRTYVVVPRLDERVQIDDVVRKSIVQQAQQAANDYGGTLWGVVAKILIKRGERLPESLLAEALVHKHDPIERTISLTAKEFLEVGLDAIVRSLADHEGLSLCSPVRLHEGYSAHLPMLDFACKASDKGSLQAVRDGLLALGQSGAIFNSGNSYHFVGSSLLTNDEWIRFMGRSLLLAPLIDTRYIGHRLYDGQSCLRVYAKSKSPREPFVEAFL